MIGLQALEWIWASLLITTYSFRSSNYHRVIGDFHCGVNAPLNSEAALSTNVCWAADQTHQIKLRVNTKRQFVAMQVIVSMPG